MDKCTFTAPRSLLNNLEELADKYNCSVSSILRELISKHLEQYSIREKEVID
jgi:hypothetical protein